MVKTSITKIDVEHVTVNTPKLYHEVKAALEANVGVLDESLRRLLREGRVDELQAGLKERQGKYGLVIHYFALHGEWLLLKGGRRNGIVYHIGNILSAVEMTSKNFGAGLYAPLRLAVYEASCGTGTIFEYDRPSSVFGQFGDPDINTMSRSLDERLAALIEAVSL